MPYNGNQYYFGYYAGSYDTPAPVYVAPTIDIGFFGYCAGWGGGWRGR